MSLYLRKVQPADIDLLYDWANDKAVRANSFHMEQISYEDHVKWFEKMIGAEDVYQYILCEDGIPAGQVRLSVDGEKAVISFSVAAPKRGKGLGSAMLSMLPECLKNDKISSVIKLTGKVKYENPASAAAFEKCGYARHEKQECIEFEFNL